MWERFRFTPSPQSPPHSNGEGKLDKAIHYSIVCIAILFSLLSAAVVYAQDSSQSVTRDDVDEIASKMYCPICENEPLDACYNSTCIQWKNEIARQLGEGRSQEEIIDYFVTRYGQHVVGVPQDPFLRGLSFFVPILGTIIALIIGFMAFRRWQSNSPLKTSKPDDSPDPSHSDEDYRSRIEQDLM